LFGVLFNSRRLFSDADAILTCNEQEARLLKEKYPGKRIQVQPHGVPVKLFLSDSREAALAAFPQLRGKQVLLLPGRIDPIKNQGWVLNHASSILQKHPQAVIVLAGPCTDKEYGVQIDDLAKTSGFANRIIFTGALPPADPRLIGLFQLAAAVILPSQSETFGLVVLESWAARAPVIASRTPGASALIRHGENGWLFDLESPHGFHDAIDAALLNPGLARQMAAAGHELAASQYDSSVLSARVQALYEELSGQNKALLQPLRKTAGSHRRLRRLA
jgi:D-inositol-3-phosphate glycosyltransferase